MTWQDKILVSRKSLIRTYSLFFFVALRYSYFQTCSCFHHRKQSCIRRATLVSCPFLFRFFVQCKKRYHSCYLRITLRYYKDDTAKHKRQWQGRSQWGAGGGTPLGDHLSEILLPCRIFVIRMSTFGGF